MHRGNRFVASFFLSAALMAPFAAHAIPTPQDDHQQQKEEQRRVYDAEHKVYHNWDDHEDAAYRHWLESRHETYVDYQKLDEKRQRAYWKWRHDHPDHP
jgi:hypothetical protein